MNRPIRNNEAKYKTVDQIIADVNLCRNTVVRIAKDAGAYIHIGRAVRIESDKFFDYVAREYTE